MKKNINAYTRPLPASSNQLRFWCLCGGSLVSLFFIASAFAQTAPTILTQPQSEAVVVGGNATISVSVAGFASSMPSVSSGTLQLWLRADAGVITNAAGQVSEWQDQSSNGNDASQSGANRPSLVFPAGIGGRAAVRFNGVQTFGVGDYLQGTGNVAVPNAMTAFTVYNSFTDTNSPNTGGNCVWVAGSPGIYGASRGLFIVNEQLDFATWTYDYHLPEPFPTNTYRLFSATVNSNLTEAHVYDITATSSNSLTFTMNDPSTPAPGYYVGGLASPSPDNLDGDVAELIVFSGYLTDADRSAVLGYLQQKYYQTGVTNGVSFQWQLDGADITGATNASLTLTDVQTNEAGTYSVIVNSAGGSTTSSNAVLTPGYAPSITVQPQSQEVVQGTNVIFTASATGTGPLSYQWSLNGADLEQATNSALNLTNVQSGNAGTYAVTVSSPFGEAVSSNAILTIALLPVITTQPQGQAVVVGSNVTLSITTAGSASLPSVSSGKLRLWLKADTGVVTNATGQVSHWEDQSGNGIDAYQSELALQPTLTNASLSGGTACAVRFNGIQDPTIGDYLAGTNDVGISNAYTSFAVYSLFNSDPTEKSLICVGQLEQTDQGRSYYINHDAMGLGTWNNDYTSPFQIPLFTYRIWTDRVDVTNGNSWLVELFDNDGASNTYYSDVLSGLLPPNPGYYVGGLGSQTRNFQGDLCETIYYSGSLSDSDRLAVQSYLQQKYYQGGSTNGASFQWQLDGTNIAGATNASLTLSDFGTNEAGSYTVTVTDPAGSTASSNAVLALLFPPLITSSPASQSVVAGTTVTFSAAATGTAPLSYQWQFDGANITGATNTSLTVSNVLASNTGSYSMVAASPYGVATSSAAILSVDESTLQVVSTSAVGGGAVVVSIDLLALGTESGLGLTLDFNPAVLTFTGVVLGSGASGGALLVNSNQAASGQLGLGAAMFNGTFSAGTQDVLDVSFQVAAVTNATVTALTFGNQPTGEQVSDPLAQTLPAVYVPGTVAISSTALAGDVSPRPNGNEVVNIDDWIQEGRFVAGLDIVSNGSEYMRADVAPRGAPAGGPITVADWVQVGRYAVGLDPLTAASGPTNASPDFKGSEHPVKDGLSRPIVLVPLSQGGETNSVAVEMIAQGNESALQFSVTFNPAEIRFINASLGSVPPNTAFIPNTNQAASGNLGFVVGLYSPATFAAGTLQLVKLNFAPVSYSNTTALAFGNAPIQCQVVDSNADVLSATYENATLTVAGLVWPTLSINQAGNNIVLSWPSSAAGFSLQASSSLEGGWTNVTATPATVGDNVEVSSPISTNAVFYRLQN